MFFYSISKVPGIMVGNAQNIDAGTGCTVILCDDNSIGGVDQRGGSPGTRETDLLRPLHLVENVNAVLLTGGSAFGLDAASGVMRFMEERGKGVDVGPTHVPIVPSAVIFDLTFGDYKIRPNADMGYEACMNATKEDPPQGNYGAGTGATIGKILGISHAMKSGIGNAAIEIGNGLWIGAIVAVNALGDIVNPENRKIIAGAVTKNSDGKITLLDTLSFLRQQASSEKNVKDNVAKSNTVIGVVVTNAKLSKNETNKLAQCAQNGLTLSIQPANTMFDGDTMFAVSTQKIEADINLVSAFAPVVTSQAIINAVKYAKPAGNLPAYCDLNS